MALKQRVVELKPKSGSVRTVASVRQKGIYLLPNLLTTGALFLWFLCSSVGL
jgi:hypothetical protein